MYVCVHLCYRERTKRARKGSGNSATTRRTEAVVTAKQPAKKAGQGGGAVIGGKALIDAVHLMMQITGRPVVG